MLAGGVYERTGGAAARPLAGYRRRTPERSVLHELVAGHAQTMLAELHAADPDGGGLPRHVEREPRRTCSAACSRMASHACNARRAGTSWSSRSAASVAGSARRAPRVGWPTPPRTS